MTHAPWVATLIAIFWTPKEAHQDLRNEVRTIGEKVLENQLDLREIKGKIDVIMQRTGNNNIHLHNESNKTNFQGKVDAEVIGGNKIERDTNE